MIIIEENNFFSFREKITHPDTNIEYIILNK